MEATSYPKHDPMCAWCTRTVRGGEPLQLTEDQLAEAACAPIRAPGVALIHNKTIKP